MAASSFHVLSDLHLEMYPGFRLEPSRVSAPFLILAGDIGGLGDATSLTEYTAFVKHCSELFETVFVVMGNHEAYRCASLEDAIGRVSLVCEAFSNVQFLNRSAVDVTTTLRVVGTTLWSHVPDGRKAAIERAINDYRCIPGFTVEAGNAQHARDVQWLEDEIVRAEEDHMELVVVTHHAPLVSGTSHPRYTASPFNSAFSTDLAHLVHRSRVKMWVHGHTHYNNPEAASNRPVVSNQRGYGNECSGSFEPYRVYAV